MRRVLLLGVLLTAMLAAGSLPVVADGPAEVIHGSWPCYVGWSDETWELEGGCEVHNVLTASGNYHLVLHGQIPDEAMAAFEADGSPKAFPTFCLVNWRFWDDSGRTDPLIWTESVRKFTPNGQMTEVCKPPVVLVIP